MRLDISNDRKELEKKANFEILGMNAIKQSSKLARDGDILKAQVHAKAWNRRMRDNVQTESQKEMYNNFQSNVGNMYSHMQVANF